MIQSYTTQYCQVTDRMSIHARLPELPALLDRTVEDLCHLLELDVPKAASVPLVIRDSGLSEVPDGTTIMIVPREDARCGLREWCELLFRHEFTHWLVQRAWGTSLVMFWEGLPVYLADNYTRTRLFHFSYHEYCAALLRHQALLSLSEGLLPHHYYGMSHDFRITAEYGSFTGYLVERYGIHTIAATSQHYCRPTPEDPVLNVRSIFQAVWKTDLQHLEEEWQTFLTQDVSVNAAAEASVSKRTYPGTVVLKDRHCQFCWAPCGPHEVCPTCHSPQNLSMTIV